MQAFIQNLNQITTNICQLLASLVILLGVIKAILIYAKDIFYREKSLGAMQESRAEIGHSFSLGLAFLIGGSILKTVVTPNWDDIGQLAAIIAIRTTLNYFLLKDIQGAVEKTSPILEVEPVSKRVKATKKRILKNI